MIYILSGIVLLFWGVWCVIAAILKRKIQIQLFYGEQFLPKKILGKHYDQAMNLFYGIICISFGLVLLFT